MTAMHGRAVLAIDETLTSPTLCAELVAATAGAITGPAVDQMLAATRDTTRVLDTFAAYFGGTVGANYAGSIPGWLRLSLIDAITGFLDGTGRVCLHNPSPLRPAPVLAVAWRPGLVVCAACASTLSPRPGSPADRTCDACGHICAGVDAGDPVYAGSIQLGPLLLSFGTCCDCRADLPEETR